jgi:hypothetical protein
MTARLTKEDEAKEEIFHKRLKEIKAGNSRWRAEKVKKERAEEREREKLHEDLRLKRERR